MPLILLCGYPCSGKTTVANLIAEAIGELKPDCKVSVISEEEIAKMQTDFRTEQSTGTDPRVSIYSNASAEKQFRSQIKAETERALSGIKSTELVVILDANNYIKGYRYELHCLAKSLRHQQAILHCSTLLDTCQYLNKKIGRYPEELFLGLVSRFEAPNPSSRWDSPLYRVSLPSNEDSSLDSGPGLMDLVSETATRIVNELLSSPTKVRPNLSTVPIQAASANYLQIMDQAATEMIDNILLAQKTKSDVFSLPSDASVQLHLTGSEWTAVTLNKAKRRFLAFVRSTAQLESSERCTTDSGAGALFLRFLNSETHQSAFLT